MSSTEDDPKKWKSSKVMWHNRLRFRYGPCIGSVHELGRAIGGMRPPIGARSTEE